jgi:hypothetical protein
MALTWQDVREIVGRFEGLNPYDRAVVPGSVLKIEDENYLRKTKTQRELFCYAISAKRYVLYNLESDGTADIRKPLEHGLGHLMNPLDPDDTDNEKWVETVWRYILDCDVRGLDPSPPEWFSLPALSRVGVSGADMYRLFARLNRRKAYADQVKPFNFMLSCQVAEYGHPRGADIEHFHLVAPFERDPRKWLSLPWFDRYTGKRYRVTTSDDESREGVARIKTYGDVVEEYGSHPEHKSLAPNGETCQRKTAGLLTRRPVEARRLRYVGKESNRLDEVLYGLIDDEDEVFNEYEDPADDPFVRLVAPILREMPRGVTAKAAGLSRSTLTRVLSGELPHPRNRQGLAGVAVNHAREQLAAAGSKVPHGDREVLQSFVELLASKAHTCLQCGREIEGGRAKFRSSTCRSRYSREKTRTQEPQGDDDR